MNNKMLRLKRGIRLMSHYLFKEKIRGLDFSLRKLADPDKMEKNIHGYSLTTDDLISGIFKNIGITKEDNFCDVGSGKGGVLYSASKFPFNRIAGIELDKELHSIAINNFEKLKIKNIELYNQDARNFSKYGEFNIFYFFNPFPLEIQKEVFEIIFNNIKNTKMNCFKRIYLICMNCNNDDLINGSSLFQLEKAYKEKLRNYDVRVWVCNL